ncbi:MAG: hypothetical protein ACOXZZ_02765 [Sphaerochaetaceae bacterium]
MSFKFKPILGIEPYIYLTVFYLIIALLIIFLIGFLPGIIKSGKRVTITSEINPVSIYVDGSYVGPGGSTLFLESGKHTVVQKFGSIESKETEFVVGRPVFLTAFFPRKQTLHLSSFFNDISTFRIYLEKMFDEVVLWSSYPIDNSFRTPNIFDMVARTSLSLDFDYESLLVDFYKSSLLYQENLLMVNQIKDSLKLLEIETDEIENLIDKVISYLERGEDINYISFKENLTYIKDDLNVNLKDLKSISGYKYDDFSVSESYITEYMWALFIEDNPYWAKDNIDQLIEDHMVDEFYLGGLYPTTVVQSNRPIRNISYNSAVAFTKWLSEITNKKISLLDQQRWMSVASSVKESPYVTQQNVPTNLNKPTALMGGYWEFTSSVFIPLKEYLGYEGSFSSNNSDIVVKGGSYLNNREDVTLQSVGVLSRSECSESASFRIMWK